MKTKGVRMMTNLLNEFLFKTKNTLSGMIQDDRGMGTVEVVLIIVVMVGLVIIFKDQITEIVNSIFESISENVSTVSS